MECKDTQLVVGYHNILDLIETLWNVKASDHNMNDTNDVGFNRDIVECKEATADEAITPHKTI